MVPTKQPMRLARPSLGLARFSFLRSGDRQLPKQGPKHTNELTTTYLKGLVVTPDMDIVWDTELHGFGLRTRGSNDPAKWRWIFKYRHLNGKQVKLTLGRIVKPGTVLTAPEARDAARDAAKKRAFDDKDVRSGKIRERELEARRDAEAAAARAVAEAEVAAAKALAEVEAAKPTVATLWDVYWASERHRLKRAAGYERLWINHLKPSFGSMKVADVEVSHVEAFKNARAATPGACNRALALLSVMMTKAAVRGYRKGCPQENPAKRSVVSRYDEDPVEFYFTAEEMGRILKAADGYSTGAAHRTNQGRRLQRGRGVGLAFRMLFHTGARAGEVFKAHWGQFSELEGGRLLWTVEASNTKGGKTITRALDADLSARLLEWRPLSLALTNKPQIANRKVPRWVFPQAARPELPVNRLENAWRDIKERAGVTEGRIHDIRHTAASHLSLHGVDLAAIGAQLGHASFVTTQRYKHVMPKGIEQTGAVLGDITMKAIEAAHARPVPRAVCVDNPVVA